MAQFAMIKPFEKQGLIPGSSPVRALSINPMYAYSNNRTLSRTAKSISDYSIPV